MAIDVSAALSEAYQLDQVKHNRGAAVAALRKTLQDDAMGGALREQHARLGAVVNARQMGEQCGCHVSKVVYDLLSAAIKDAEQ